jgi:DNA topoisomerase-1
MSNLLIVESPAKAKTIKKYLGPGYEVIASMGHVRDLPANKLNVDIRHNFKPNYEIIKGKEDLVNELIKLAKKNKKVFLATDPDREGEAISWHLAYILDLDPKEKNRVTFNEITKSGVTKGMAEPRAIDIDLVNAQQARRILDRIVGYKLSPFLSGKIRKGLSAGRVQSVALRIIVDRENEIRLFIPVEYWTIDAKLTAKGSRKVFFASLYADKNGKIDIKNEAQAKQILKELDNAAYTVENVKKGTKKRTPAPPFITSTLQQDASRKLGFQAKRTMKIAQELYEGVDVEGQGAVGLITYMRTDSLRISDDAINSATDYIKATWGEKYLPAKKRVFKTKANAQDGHEAIRPTMPNLSPASVKGSLTSDQFKLYKLIWERFIASQMADCLLNTTRIEIAANDYLFKSSGFTVSFDGFTVLYQEGKDEEEEKAKELPNLEKGTALNLKELLDSQHFTQPPARYTEASLIKALEENGIGRPSTYAATISTITGREYVRRESKTLIPTELGEVVTQLMKERFSDIVDVKFTAKMENDLDTVESGKEEWTHILSDFYDDFNEDLKKAKEDMKNVKIHLKEDETDLICDKCGKPMVVKRSRYGKFVACSGYPECKNIIRNVNKDGEPESSVEPEESDVVCEKCGRKMVIKTGRYGKFLACPGYPECKNIKGIDVSLGIPCPKCGGDIVARKTKRGRTFYGCGNYPKCDFISNDKPIEEKCPNCGKNLFEKSGKKKKIYCMTENCGYEKNEEK